MLGFAVMVVGIWANVEGKNYVEVTESTSHILEVSVLVIILGLFVLIVGIVGVVGGIFASTIFGRITLGLVSRVLLAYSLVITVSMFIPVCCHSYSPGHL